MIARRNAIADAFKQAENLFVPYDVVPHARTVSSACEIIHEREGYRSSYASHTCWGAIERSGQPTT
jgi:hypothetical protein